MLQEKYIENCKAKDEMRRLKFSLRGSDRNVQDKNFNPNVDGKYTHTLLRIFQQTVITEFWKT